MAEKSTPAPDRAGKVAVEGGSRRVYWEYYGKGDREVVCLLNGLAMDTRAWAGFLPQVHPEYDVLLWNYFGQEGGAGQESSTLDEPYSIARFADYLAAIMDEAGVGKLHLVGVSYGGFVGAEFARAYPRRVATLTLSGIFLTREVGFQLYQDISLLFYTRSEEIFEVYTHYMYEKIFGDAFAEKIRGETMAKMRDNFFNRYRGKRHCLVRLTEAQDPFFAAIDADPARWRAVESPVLVMAGNRDRAIPPWYQAKIAGLVPASRYMEVPESGHLTYMERPDFFWPRLRAFMAAKSVDFKEPADV